MAKFKEILAMSENELNDKIIEAKQELVKERAAIASGTRSENPGKIRKLRREIARMLTALRQKKGKPVAAKKSVGAEKKDVKVKEAKATKTKKEVVKKDARN